ncbi:uncharacterized protein J3R85_009471 [Psidium guajava]|nr:uncharacterized protein J3R85_009471 [Psidium guajava]
MGKTENSVRNSNEPSQERSLASPLSHDFFTTRGGVPKIPQPVFASAAKGAPSMLFCQSSSDGPLNHTRNPRQLHCSLHYRLCSTPTVRH